MQHNRSHQQQRTNYIFTSLDWKIRLFQGTISHEEVLHCQSTNKAAAVDDLLGNGEVLHEGGAAASWDVDEEEVAGEGYLLGGCGFDEPRHGG